MVVGALLALGASSLWSNTNTAEEITANTRRISEARHAAHSGMSHFISLHLSDQDVQERLLIPETQLTSKTAYEVEAIWIDETHLMVMSRGRYKDGSETVVEYPMRAVFTPDNGAQRGEGEESN